jgi:hypothetical protein
MYGPAVAGEEGIRDDGDTIPWLGHQTSHHRLDVLKDMDDSQPPFRFAKL